MATVTLADLLGTYTEDALITTQLSVLSAASFPVTAWEATSVPRVLVQADARSLLDLANTVPRIAAGSFVSLAEDEWLDLKGGSDFDEDRIPAVTCVRTLRLTDSSGAPTVIAAGDLTATSAEGLVYTNASGGTLAASSSLDLDFAAEEAGVAYNAATASWELATPIPGVAVTDPLGVVTLVTAGADAESDDAYRARCIAKWSALGAGANDEAYTYWAQTATGLTETISRVAVYESTPDPGQVTIYIATATATASSASVTAVQDYIDPTSHLGKAPNCVDVIVASAAAYNVVPTGTIKVRAATYSAAVTAALAGLFNTLASETDIGGTVYRAEIIQRIMSLDGVINCTITVPAADVALADDEIITFGTPSFSVAT